MQRKIITPRPNWEEKLEKIGFLFYHTPEGPYWDESAFYTFSNRDVELIEKATADLFELCLQAVQHVIDKRLYKYFQVLPEFIPLIEKSWNDDLPSIYGRFDLVYDGNNFPKMLEFNADTPTSLFEAGVVQWYWLQDVAPDKDQFNSIHDKLINYWKVLIPYLNKGKVHFSCIKNTIEDLVTAEYMRDVAIQAGLDTEFIFVEDIGWHEGKGCFVDLKEEPINNLFKLYPWEWMATDEFGKNILRDKQNTIWIEPAWKMLLSNKAILPVLWGLFPNHPNLLPAYFDSAPLGNTFVKKPILAREGANVTIVKDGNMLISTPGTYGKEGYIFQQYFPLPENDGNHTVVGSWVIGCEPAGIGIRETRNIVTDNFSRFVPHMFY
jgi:glutathionylspermidine synthase